MSTSDNGTCQCCPRCRCHVTSTWVKIFLSLSSYRPNIFFCTTFLPITCLCLFVCVLHIQLITTVVEMILSILVVDSSMGSNAMSIMPCIQLRGFYFFTHVNCWLWSLCVQRQQEHGVGDRGWSYWRKEVLTSISITKTSSPAYLLCYVYIVWSCLLSPCSAQTTLTTRRTLHCTSFGVIHFNSRRVVVVLFKPFLSLLVLAEECRVPS
jgi:hypothetical protein